MTPAGYEKLQKELEQIKTVERPRNIKSIEEARAHGDLSENADYDAAKNEQGLIAARLAQVEDRLARAEVIDPKSLSGTTVMFGATVTLIDVESEEKVVYKLVGSFEADLKEKTISIESPIGKSLIGKSEGDEVVVKTPGGFREFSIQKVEYK
ncbi:MAG: transcription elongation factor GreA [Deltaproteobacteria bacterium]|nr:transcription elongation factor GreA [Deltaproteobacteria bacterium]